jgi:hypothetical protein
VRRVTSTATRAALATVLAVAPAIALADEPPVWRRHAIEVSPVAALVGIYGAQYAYALTPHDEVIGGAAYMNIHYDQGATHAPTLVLGYRRTFWRGAHVEYLLMPGYDWFSSDPDGQTWRSFELWNEARLGYRFDFEAGSTHLFVSAQWALGFALYGGDKPRWFQVKVGRDPVFSAPFVFTGVAFQV